MLCCAAAYVGSAAQESTQLLQLRCARTWLRFLRESLCVDAAAAEGRHHDREVGVLGTAVPQLQPSGGKGRGKRG